MRAHTWGRLRCGIAEAPFSLRRCRSGQPFVMIGQFLSGFVVGMSRHRSIYVAFAYRSTAKSLEKHPFVTIV